MAISDQRRLELYDRMSLWIEKGKREQYKAIAAEFGMSLKELVQTGVETFIAERSLSDLSVKPAPICAKENQKISAEQKKLIEDFSKLPVETQKSLKKLIATIIANPKPSD